MDERTKDRRKNEQANAKFPKTSFHVYGNNVTRSPLSIDAEYTHPTFHTTNESSEASKCSVSCHPKIPPSACTSALPLTASELVLQGYLLYGHAGCSSSDSVRPSTYADISEQVAPDKCSSRVPSPILRRANTDRGETVKPPSHMA